MKRTTKTKSLSELLTVVARDHFPRKPPKKAAAALAALERRAGHKLPTDVRKFYARHDGASLFDTSPSDAYELLPLRRWRRAPEDVCPESWFVFCEVGDDNGLALDLATTRGARCRVIDVFHETLDEGRVVAESFTLFLARALASDGEHFWLRTRGAKPKEKTSKKGDTKAKGFGPADFVDPDGELLAWVEQERGRPVIRWELTITFAELQRGATQIVPQLVLELRDERLRDWRELRRLEAPSKKAKAVFHWATFTKSSGSSKRLKPRNVRLDIVGRRGTRLSVRYAIELQPPGSPSLTLEGDVAVDFNAFCVTADVLGDEPSVEAAAKMLRAVAAPSSFGKLALTRLGEVEAKPRG